MRQLQSTGSLAPGTIGKILSGRGVKRGDDLSSGGRLSRRNADPVAEAERKAQQEKLYALDLDRVLAGQSTLPCPASIALFNVIPMWASLGLHGRVSPVSVVAQFLVSTSMG